MVSCGRQGFFPTSVYEEGKDGGGGAKAAKKEHRCRQDLLEGSRQVAKKSGAKNTANKAVKPKILMIFTRQLATLIDAGLPLLRGLMVLEKQERDPVLKATIGKLSDAVQGGSTFSEGLAQHPKIFNKLYINMVKAGEVGGVLELVLIRLGRVPGKGAEGQKQGRGSDVLPDHRVVHRHRHHGLPAGVHRAEVRADFP